MPKRGKAQTNAGRRRPITSHDRCLRIVEVENPEVSAAHVSLAIRTLARMMLRRYQNGDPVANVPPGSRSSDLTVVPKPSPHHDDEEA